MDKPDKMVSILNRLGKIGDMSFIIADKKYENKDF